MRVIAPFVESRWGEARLQPKLLENYSKALMDRKFCQIYIFKNKMDLKKKKDTLLLQLMKAEG